MTRKETPPTLQTNPFFAYDRAVADLVRCRVGSPMEDVPITFGTPRREYADQAHTNPDRKLEEKDGLSKERANLTVPHAVMSVKRIGTHQFDPSRFNTGRDQPLFLRQDRKSWETAMYPLPYIFPYQVDVLSKFRPILNQVVVDISLRFKTPYIWMPIDWGKPYGVRNVEASLVGSIDTSMLESREQDTERDLRHTFQVRVTGWLLGKRKSVPSAVKIMATQVLVPTAAALSDPEHWEIVGTTVDEGNTATGEVTEHYEVGK